MGRLVVDQRERQLLGLLPGVERATLDVGDVLCRYEDGSGWIAERKTASDLAASLKDGRWAEQKDREHFTLRDTPTSVPYLWGVGGAHLSREHRTASTRLGS